MEQPKQVQRGASAANICYMMVGAFPENSTVELLLYRSACIAIDAVTLVEIVSHLVPTKDHSYFDQAVWDVIGDTAEARQWEAQCLKTVGESPNLPRKCVDAAAEAIESSVDLYISAQGKLTDATEENWGSILDFKSPASRAILSAFDAFEDAEEVYRAAEYPQAIPGYWACYEALRAAGLLMGSYDPAITKLQPYLFNMDHLQYLTEMYRSGAKQLFEAMNESVSPVSLVSADSAVKAFTYAQDAMALAIANLRSAKLLEEDRVE